ncbi:MAG: hypothetical protein ATN31_05805 [Candidatus Epulonipiscioides saccharophilum]|nr:MAG: hypothetical protein ATN31_05805 [Epulopiscium sp. AS2M-Bin001]
MSCNCTNSMSSNFSDSKPIPSIVDQQKYYREVYQNCQGYGATFNCSAACLNNGGAVPINPISFTTPMSAYPPMPGSGPGPVITPELLEYMLANIPIHGNPIPTPTPPIQNPEPTRVPSTPGADPSKIGPSKPGEFFEIKCAQYNGETQCFFIRKWVEIGGTPDKPTFTPMEERVPITFSGLSDLFLSLNKKEEICDPTWFNKNYYGRCIPFNLDYQPPWVKMF